MRVEGDGEGEGEGEGGGGAEGEGEGEVTGTGEGGGASVPTFGAVASVSLVEDSDRGRVEGVEHRGDRRGEPKAGVEEEG